MLNKNILIGNVGDAPDIRTMANGGRVANFSLATGEYWTDKNGQRQNRTEWHKIVVYSENLVKLVEKAVHKGSKLYVEGTIRSRKYVSKDGTERTSHEIVLQGFDHTIKLLDPRQRDTDNSGFSNDKLEKNDDGDSDDSDSCDDSSEGDEPVDDEIPF